MANYSNLRTAFKEQELQNRCASAMIVATRELLEAAATPTLATKHYAAMLFGDVESEARRMFIGLLAKHADKTLNGIQSLTDAELLTEARVMVPILRDARFG